MHRDIVGEFPFGAVGLDEVLVLGFVGIQDFVLGSVDRPDFSGLLLDLLRLHLVLFEFLFLLILFSAVLRVHEFSKELRTTLVALLPAIRTKCLRNLSPFCSSNSLAALGS